jgi:hypothetical protein
MTDQQLTYNDGKRTNNEQWSDISHTNNEKKVVQTNNVLQITTDKVVGKQRKNYGGAIDNNLFQNSSRTEDIKEMGNDGGTKYELCRQIGKQFAIGGRSLGLWLEFKDIRQA